MFQCAVCSQAFDTLTDLVTSDPHPSWAAITWSAITWSARVMLEHGDVDGAIAWVQARSGLNDHPARIARFAEDALLSAGRRSEAFERYALIAHEATTNLNTFRALHKRYPEVDSTHLLKRLLERHPGQEGKWFATAKTLKLYDTAVELSWRSPCDPRTLIRAATAHQSSHPAFALECALAALHWIILGHGYEVTALDLHQAWAAGRNISERPDQEAARLRWNSMVPQLRTAASGPSGAWAAKVLGWG